MTHDRPTLAARVARLEAEVTELLRVTECQRAIDAVRRLLAGGV